MTEATETAILAGGCFWGMQDLIRKLPGVVSTRVGYSGGEVPNATYRNHGNHAEAIEISYDADQTSFRALLWNASKAGAGSASARATRPARHAATELASAFTDCALAHSASSCVAV